MLARRFMRLPLWARIAAGVVVWALVYHFWLPFATWLTVDVFHLASGRLASSLQFFIYDTVKVLLLLTIVVFGVGHGALVLQPAAHARPASRPP